MAKRPGKAARMAARRVWQGKVEAINRQITLNKSQGLWSKGADAKPKNKPDAFASISYNFKANTHKQFSLRMKPTKGIWGKKQGNKVIRSIPKATVTDSDLYTQKPDMLGGTVQEPMVRTGTSKRGPRWAIVGKSDSVPKDGGKK